MTRLTVTRPAEFQEFPKESINQGIHQRFEEQARLHPENIALKTQTAAFTYAQTNGFANSIAAEILSATSHKLAQVALLLPNTPELILAILASLKAHKIYVPLDRNFPRERLGMMLEDAGPALLLTDDEHLDLAEKIAGKNMHILNLSQIKRQAAAPNPGVECPPLDPAYILYTSGSTGRPKGITFLHRNLLHTTMCLTNELFFASSDRVTWLHSPSFGSSVVDIYCCLTNGGTLYPWDTKAQGFIGMADWFIQEKVTTFQWIPSAFRQFMRTISENTVFHDIRIVILAGEPLTVREVEIFRKHFPEGSHLVNQVGTGESYNYYLYRVDHAIPIESANVAGGYPVSEDRQLLILDEQRRELPQGSVGEIAIKSDYMSAGYWRDDALTHEKFIRLGTEATPVYLTGDLGKLEPDGCLIHLGRKDFQVKIRGCRIEVAEVEHYLSSAPGVADSAVWIAKNRLGEDQLVGYVVRKTRAEFSQKLVEEYLGTKLPDYMVPRHYVFLDALPALPTGKTNRRALPNPLAEVESGAKAAPVPPPASVEQEVVNLFKELLQLEDITEDSHFLNLGGDSLLTAVLMHHIQQRFKVEILFDDLGEPLTPVNLARLIKAALESGKVGAFREKPAPQSGEPITRRAATGPLFEPVHFTRPRTIALEPRAADQRSSVKPNLIIIGAGQFGREVFTWATQAIASGFHCRIKGFLDKRADALEGYDYVAKILGDAETYRIEEGDVFVGSIGNPRVKQQCYSPIVERGGHFINIIHPLANIGNNVQLGIGIVMGPFASVTCDVKIGNHVTIGAFSNAGHDTIIGDGCQISSHCGINGKATLGEGVFLGSHACIIPKIKVGAWAFVGAGSVVVRDVPPGVSVFGNPASPIGRVKRHG